MRNKWHLYEWLKQRYMASGRVPEMDEARAEFRELSIEEMGEGYLEFFNVIGRYGKGA